MTGTPDTDVATENRRLRERLRALTEEAAKNERILRNFQSLELDLLTADSLPDLLQRLASGVARNLRLEEVTVVVRDSDREIQHLLIHHGREFDALPGVLFTEDLGQLSPLYVALRAPRLGPFVESEHGQLFAGMAPVGSVAVLPLLTGSRLMGSLNLGSADGLRYTRRHATDFLARLAIIASVCLENVINRERTVLSGLTDVLTGWYNTRYLRHRLVQELARARRYQQPLGVLLFDIDHFKTINDDHGHPAGDMVLRALAARVKSVLRSSDVPVRHGGEEFLVLLPQTDGEAAARLGERVRREVAARPFRLGELRNIHVTVSVGVAEELPDAERKDLEAVASALVERADRALYRAKDEGRNRVSA